MALRKLITILALTWLAGTAQAAPSPRTALAEGNRLFAAGDYAAAFEVFAAAQQRWPRPVFLRSMAFCQLKRARHREALELLRRYRASYPHAGDAARITAAIAELEVAMATRLNVSSTPSGAAVFLDTEASGQRGTTPFAGPLAPGRHTLILQRPGFEPTTRDFVLAPRQQLTLALRLAVGLHVTSSPSGAALHVTPPDADASAAGRAPVLGRTPFHGTLPSGHHTLWLLHPNCLPFRQPLHLDRPGAVTLHAPLRVGLRVESTPAGARLRLDGQPVAGVTPLELAATPGDHQLELEHPDYQTTQRRVRVASGPHAGTVRIALRGGLLTMRSRPLGAQVSVDGRPLGTTPLVEVTVPLGRHTLALSHAAHGSWRARVPFTLQETVAAEVTLGRPRWPAWVGAAIAAVGLSVGLTAGVIAWRHVDRVNDATRYDPTGVAAGRGYCRGGGAPYRGLYKDSAATLPITGDDCGLAAQHTATAGLVSAALAGAFATTYYLWFARPVARLTRHEHPRPDPRAASAAAGSEATAASPVAAPAASTAPPVPTSAAPHRGP